MLLDREKSVGYMKFRYFWPNSGADANVMNKKRLVLAFSLWCTLVDIQTVKFKSLAHRSKIIQPYQTVNFDLHDQLFSQNVFCIFIIYFAFGRGSGDNTSTYGFDIRRVILSLSLYDGFRNYNKNQYLTREKIGFVAKSNRGIFLQIYQIQCQ